MQLSSWMFKKQLGNHVTSWSIEDGQPTITGIRLFDPAELAASENYLYIGRMADVVTDARFEATFMLLNRRDWIQVTGFGFDELVNRLLSIFELYNSWEARLHALAARTDALQELADVSHEMIARPLFISDAGDTVLAVTGEGDPGTDDENWRYMAENREVDPRILSYPIVTEDGRQMSYWDETARVYPAIPGSTFGTIGVAVIVDGEIRGVVASTGGLQEPGPEDIQHVQTIADILRDGAYFRSPEIRQHSISQFLETLIEGGEASETGERLTAARNFKPPWQVAVFRGLFRNDISQGAALVRLAFTTGCELACIHDDLVVLLDTSAALIAHVEAMLEDAGADKYTVGVSLPFSKIDATPAFHEQALFAIGQGNGQAGIFHCADFAYQRLLALTRGHNDALRLTHPALGTLKAYDAEHETDFYHTLHIYLRDERSLVKAAADLFIHRNSLMYRIKRIGEIVDVDLDDAGGRAYLLLSYELEDDERPANPSVVAGGVDASTAADISSTGSAASGGTAVPEGLPPK